MIGTTVGSYQLQRELGRGGMGAVYVGKHTLLGRTAAVKVLLPDFSKNQDMVQRFFNEARAATAIKHPGIVEIYDFGYAEDGSAFIVMEFLEGEPLSARLRRFGKLAPTFAVAVARQVATALGVAHKAGIVHRDLKPDNVFLVPDAEVAIGERIKLLDFGIAKLAGDTSPGNMAKTSTGTIMGTPYYMSPEQCRGAGQVDGRSDLYALGCMMYEMIGGRVPFVAEGAGDILAAHLLLPPQPLRTFAPDVPADVEALVMRLLAKTPEERPRSAETCAEELAAIGKGLGLATSLPPRALDAAPGTAPSPSEAHVATIAQPALAPTPKRVTTLGASTGQEIVKPPPRRTGLVIGVAVVALAGASAAGIYVMQRPKASSATTTEPTPNPQQPSQPTGPTEDLHLIAARTAIETQMWTEAVIAAEAASRADPSNQEAKDLGALARRENAAQISANAMRDAIELGDLVTAAARFAAIPDDSTYKRAALRDLDAGREAYVLERTPDVQALIKAGKCKEAKALVTELTSGAGTGPTEPLTRAVGKCKTAKTTSKPPTNVNVWDAVPEQRMEEARQMMLDGRYAAARKIFEDLVAKDPSDARARFNAALAAEKLHDCAGAKKLLEDLHTPKADRLRARCR